MRPSLHQGAPIPRRRNRQLRHLVHAGRPTSRRLSVDLVPVRLRRAPRQRGPRRRGLRHRVPDLHPPLGRPSPGDRRLQHPPEENLPIRGAPVRHPGPEPRRRHQDRAVRLRVGAVLQQPALRLQRRRGQPDQVVERLERAGAGGERAVPGAAGGARGGGVGVHRPGEPEERDSAGDKADGQLWRGDAVE